jgi:hypothetical protein
VRESESVRECVSARESASVSVSVRERERVCMRVHALMRHNKCISFTEHSSSITTEHHSSAVPLVY